MPVNHFYFEDATLIMCFIVYLFLNSLALRTNMARQFIDWQDLCLDSLRMMRISLSVNLL